MGESSGRCGQVLGRRAVHQDCCLIKIVHGPRTLVKNCSTIKILPKKTISCRCLAAQQQPACKIPLPLPPLAAQLWKEDRGDAIHRAQGDCCKFKCMIAAISRWACRARPVVRTVPADMPTQKLFKPHTMMCQLQLCGCSTPIRHNISKSPPHLSKAIPDRRHYLLPAAQCYVN